VISRKEELLASFDDAWSYKWESFEYVLQGIGEKEALYQHPIYVNEPPEDGYPPAGTILWHLVHLAHCYKHYVTIIEQRPNRPPDPAAPESHTLAEAVTNLKLYRDKLREAFAALEEEQFDDELSNARTIASFARMVVRHDAWHSGQIALARRLFRASQ